MTIGSAHRIPRALFPHTFLRETAAVGICSMGAIVVRWHSGIKMSETSGTSAAIDVVKVDPSCEPAVRMAAALWVEIQARYGFTAPDPFDPSSFAGPVGGFWIALDDAEPVGSIALTPLEAGSAELDVMYVAPTHRRRGVAQALLAALETHATTCGVTEIVLRAGDPQPEALAFYRAVGFSRTERFGRWVDDATAVCLRKSLG